MSTTTTQSPLKPRLQAHLFLSNGLPASLTRGWYSSWGSSGFHGLTRFLREHSMATSWGLSHTRPPKYPCCCLGTIMSCPVSHPELPWSASHSGVSMASSAQPQ